MGELASAHAHFEQGAAHYDPHQPRASWMWEDSGVACLSQHALLLWYLGYPDQALKRSHEALTRARDCAPHYPGLCPVLGGHTPPVPQRRASRPKGGRGGVHLRPSKGFRTFWPGEAFCGAGRWPRRDREQEGIVADTPGPGRLPGKGDRNCVVVFSFPAGRGAGKVGQAEEGLTVLAEALAMVDRTREHSTRRSCIATRRAHAAQSSVQSLGSQRQKSAIRIPQSAIRGRSVFSQGD